MGQNASSVGEVTKQINQSLTLWDNKKLLFRDSGIFMHSNVDGKLLISSDGTGTDDITFSGTVTFNNDAVFSGNLQVDGNFTFGNAATDNLIVTGYQSNTYSGTAQDAVSVTASGDLAAGKNGIKVTLSGAAYSATSYGIHIAATGAGTAGAYALYINATGANVEGLKVDAGTSQFDEAVTITGAITMDGTPATGFLISGATTTAVSVTGNATDVFKTATGTFTTCINLGGTITTAITIGACTTGMNLTGAVTTGLLIGGNATDGVKISGGTITDAIEIGASTNAINIAGNVTSSIIQAGTYTDFIVMNGAGTNFINFDAVEGVLTTSAGATTVTHKIAINIAGVGTRYIKIYSDA